MKLTKQLLKKFIKEEKQKLIKKGALTEGFVWDRKFGESLPTLADTTKAYAEKNKMNEAPGFESKDGKTAIRQYQKLYTGNVGKGEQYFASSVDSLADFMEQQGLKNQAQLLRGEYQMVIQKWYDKWLKQFVKSLK